MTASTHRKIRKNGRNWVTKINKKGKQPLVAPVVVEDGPVLMASTTVGTQANSSDFIFYKGGQSKNTRMSFIIDTTKNPDNASDKTTIIPFTLYTPSYSFKIDWGDGNSTTYPANSALTTVGLTHTYSTAGQYTIVITSDSQKIPVLNWSTSGNVGGNKHKLIQLSTPLITFDTACPNSNSAQYFAYECDNLLFIANQFFINNPQIRNYDYCFSKCSKLVKVPFDIFKYVKYQSTYQEVFAHDIALQTVPNDLFATAKAIDLGGAFSGDSNLVLDVDLDTFFGTEPYINVDVHDIFRDCVKTTGDAVEFTKKFTEYVAYVIGTGTFDTGWGTLTGKIYAQPIYNSDGKLVRDLVPAKTGNFYGGKSAPQDCLWDEVQQEFLLPTSTFTYGTEKDVRDSYVFEGKTGEVGYDVVGSPTIVDGIATCDGDNYFVLTSAFSPVNYTISEAVFRITPTTVTGEGYFFCSRIDNTDGGRFGLRVGIFNSTLRLTVGDTLNWNNQLNGITTLVAGNTYDVMYKREGNTTKLYLKINGEWNEEISTTRTPNNFTVTCLGAWVGTGTAAKDYVFKGSIDLNNTYIKVDGNLWFGNQTQLVGCNESVYLKGDGNSWIDTEIYGDLSTEIRSKLLDNTSSATYLWGAGFAADVPQALTMYSYGGLNCRFGSKTTTLKLFSNTDISKVIQNKTGIYVNDILKATYGETSNFTTKSTLGLMRIKGGDFNYFTGYVYYFKILKDDILIQHLVPVPKGLQIGYYTVPSNGMWDIVEQKFYPNQGTGAFTLGGFTFDNIENNLPYSFKKNALYNCEQWSNFAIPESVWTGIPSSREDWLAVNEGKTNWLLTDSMNMLLLESANSNILCSPTDTLKADTEALLSWYTGTMPEHVQGIIKPEPYESVDSLRNIINALPELRGYEVVDSPTINNGVASGFSDTSYLTTSFPTTIPTKTECVINFTTGNTITGSSNQSIINFVDFLNLEINTSGQLYTYDYTKKQRVGNVGLATHTKYYCNILFDNGQKTLSLSTDGTNYTTFANFNDTTYVSHAGYVCLGKHPTNTGRFFKGSIDLNKTYIKLNNKVWFDGTEKLNEVLDLSGCVNKGGLTSAELQTVIDKGYTLVLN